MTDSPPPPVLLDSLFSTICHFFAFIGYILPSYKDIQSFFCCTVDKFFFLVTGAMDRKKVIVSFVSDPSDSSFSSSVPYDKSNEMGHVSVMPFITAA